jgi:hypothetical protein
MTFKEEMETFWKGINEPADKAFLEGDSEYQHAINAENAAKAQEIACDYIYALIEVKEWMQSQRAKKSSGSKKSN